MVNLYDNADQNIVQFMYPCYRCPVLSSIGSPNSQYCTYTEIKVILMNWCRFLQNSLFKVSIWENKNLFMTNYLLALTQYLVPKFIEILDITSMYKYPWYPGSTVLATKYAPQWRLNVLIWWLTKEQVELKFFSLILAHPWRIGYTVTTLSYIFYPSLQLFIFA